MKRYGYKEVKELIENDNKVYIRLDTMPFTTSFPCYAVMKKQSITNDQLLGFMSYNTFYKLKDNGIISLKKRNFSNEEYF